MRLLVKNIARIVGIESTGRLRCCGADMNKLGTLDDAWLLAEDGRFAAFGRMDSLGDIAADEVVDAAGGMLFPSFCDSHTHLVYAGSREREFLDKINGLSYEEIAFSTPPTGCTRLRRTNSMRRRWSACARSRRWVRGAWRSRAATAFRPGTS